MNAQNAAQFVSLIQALADGKTIQVHKRVTDEWIDLNEMEFSMEPEKYRIKPEPVDCWLCRSDSSNPWQMCYHEFVGGCYHKLRIHVREIV